MFRKVHLKTPKLGHVFKSAFTMKCRIIISFLLGLSSTFLPAQQTIPATGGNGTNSSGTINYTVGQIGYSSVSNSQGSVDQGVQHAYEISVIDGLAEYESINLVVSTYPNPTIDFLHLQIENYNQYELHYQLLDLAGKVIRTQKVQYSVTRISMESLAASTYFLRILKDNTSIKTFKIIKQ